MRSKVVLPAPLWPISAAPAPLGTFTLTLCSTMLRPYPAVTSTSSSALSLMGSAFHDSAQVDLLNLGVGLDLRDRALGQHLACMHDRDEVGEVAHEIHVV